jgi:hypothetical protein
VPALAHGAATVSLQPAAGPPGSVVTLRGVGLPAGKAVTVRIGSRKVRVVAGRRGAFVARVRIPRGAHGRPALITRAAGVRIANRFAVMRGAVEIGEVAGPGRARLRWMPLRAASGTVLELHGVGLPRRRPVTISLAGKRVASVRSTRAGKFAAKVTVPASAAGPLAGVVRSGRVRMPFVITVLGDTSAGANSGAGRGAGPGSGSSGAAPGGSVTAPSTGPPPPAPNGEPSFPIRAAFYYPWFPETWGSGSSKYTHYHPTAGFYSSDDTAVIARHLDELRYGNIQVGISSWWGQGHYTDKRLGTILSVTHSTGSPVRWAVYYENEGFGDPSVAQLASDLKYLRDKYASDPAFLKLGGRFVVFAYGDGNDSCGMVDRWRQASAGTGAYIVLKLFPGYMSCASQPDGWHQYAPAVRADAHPGQSFEVSPGFWLATDSAPRLARDPGCFRAAVRDMVASGAPWQLVTTFSEWGEGTSVEPASEWQTSSGYGAYLDALHDNGAGAPAGPPC